MRKREERKSEDQEGCPGRVETKLIQQTFHSQNVREKMIPQEFLLFPDNFLRSMRDKISFFALRGGRPHRK
jgi:hypothetical protein